MSWDDSDVDIYRLIKLCGLLVGLWLVQVFGLGQFRSGMAAKPPRYNIFDFDGESGRLDSKRPIDEIAKQRGWDARAPFVSADGAKQLELKYQRERWLAYGSLVAALASAAGTVVTGYRIWDSWRLGLAVVLFGPVAIAWGMSRLKDGCAHPDRSS